MNSAHLTNRKLSSFLATFALVALLVTASLAHGADTPFAALSGAWSGPGTITLASGGKESIRCRAKYEVDGNGTNLKLNLRCSSDSHKFDLQADVSHANGQVSSHANGQVSGFWNESLNRVGGTVAGKATAGLIDVVVDGPISAMLTVKTRADSQSVSIRSPGGAVSSVAISLSRGSKQTALK